MNSKNLQYITEILQLSEGPNNAPTIYFLWGCIVFFGYVIAEYHLESITGYWLIAAPIGFLASIWLGIRHSKKVGQRNNAQGNLYIKHFAIMLLFIFLAIFTHNIESILLLIGIGYCLAGIHLDKFMLWVGIVFGLVYVGLTYELINNNLIIGSIFSASFFAAAWAVAKSNNHGQ